MRAKKPHAPSPQIPNRSNPQGAAVKILEFSDAHIAHRRVLVANCHLFWNPKRPDIKTVQVMGVMRLSRGYFSRVAGIEQAEIFRWGH